SWLQSFARSPAPAAARVPPAADPWHPPAAPAPNRSKLVAPLVPRRSQSSSPLLPPSRSPRPRTALDTPAPLRNPATRTAPLPPPPARARPPRPRPAPPPLPPRPTAPPPAPPRRPARPRAPSRSLRAPAATAPRRASPPVSDSTVARHGCRSTAPQATARANPIAPAPSPAGSSSVGRLLDIRATAHEPSSAPARPAPSD